MNYEQVSVMEESISNGIKVPEIQITTLIEMLMMQAIKLDTIAAEGAASTQKIVQVKTSLSVHHKTKPSPTRSRARHVLDGSNSAINAEFYTTPNRQKTIPIRPCFFYCRGRECRNVLKCLMF